MQALTYDRFGEPGTVVSAASIPKPEPGPGAVRLRMLRSPIHNHDLATIRGTYGYKPELPAIAGSEFIGAVDALGPGIENVPIGARAAGSARGAWAEYVVVPAASMVPIPETISDDVGAQLLAMPLSAVVLLNELRVEPGTWIGQNAAGGAVGRILMRLAQAQGINIVNIVRGEKAAEDLRSHGAKNVVVTNESGGWQQQIRDLTGGKGLARIVDSVAGPQTLELQRILAPRGEIIIFGGLSGAAVKLDPSLMISLECVVRGFWMTKWMERATVEQRAGAMQQVFQMAMAGSLPLPVAGVYPLSDFKPALVAAETSGRAGKVLFST